jgi:hypothetical protein
MGSAHIDIISRNHLLLCLQRLLVAHRHCKKVWCQRKFDCRKNGGGRMEGRLRCVALRCVALRCVGWPLLYVQYHPSSTREHHTRTYAVRTEPNRTDPNRSDPSCTVKTDNFKKLTATNVGRSIASFCPSVRPSVRQLAVCHVASVPNTITN